jgi:hypothetical protein
VVFEIPSPLNLALIPRFGVAILILRRKIASALVHKSKAFFGAFVGQGTDRPLMVAGLLKVSESATTPDVGYLCFVSERRAQSFTFASLGVHAYDCRFRRSLREPSGADARALVFALWPVTCTHPCCGSKYCA